MTMHHQKRIIICTVVGLIAAIIGITAICLIPGLISMIVHKKMALIPGNPSYPLWRDLDLPIYQNFYFYNVTNPVQVEKNGARPNLVEVGPFVFRLNLTKSELDFYDNRTKLTFRENRRYYFDRKLSVADLNVSLTTLNVPLAVAYDTIDFDSMSRIARLALKLFLSKQSFFFTATPDELIFTGKSNVISCMAHVIDPVHNPDCNFSYFRGQNNTDDGLYEIYTGLGDPIKVNSIISLNGSSKLDTWDGDECNDIVGSSNGELFPSLDLVSGPGKNLKFFRSDFCRVFNLTLNKQYIPADVSSSMLVDRFVPAENMFANETVNPANSCYKPNPNKTVNVEMGEEPSHTTLGRMIELFEENGFEMDLWHDLWAKIEPNKSTLHSSTISAKLSSKKGPQPERPSGVFDLSACHDGVPILISWPHFLSADPIYLAQVTGLRPNITKHETYIDIEPLTGTPVDFLARIQVNIDVQTQLADSVKMKSIVFPTLWQEFTIHITDEMAHTITSQTRTPKIAAFSIASLLAVVGVALILYAILLVVMNLHRKRLSKQGSQTPPLLSETDDQDQTLDREDSTNNNSIVHD